jgi:hypothetical protein
VIVLRAVTTSFIWSALGASAWACPVCFRMDDGPVSDGVRAAIVVLMGVTTTVLAGFAVFIRGFMQRERTAEPRNPTPEPRNLGTQPRNLGTPEPRH